jgi:hypothetical protein
LAQPAESLPQGEYQRGERLRALLPGIVDDSFDGVRAADISETLLHRTLPSAEPISRSAVGSIFIAVGKIIIEFCDRIVN